MEELRKYLSGSYTTVEVKFAQPNWHIRARIPARPGWYFFETTTPFGVLAQQALWAHQYAKKTTQELADVKNYNLQVRCARFQPALAAYWNTQRVYSGLASNLQSRAREHTFADPGTGGLALSKYPELHSYQWFFNYRTLDDFSPNCLDPRVLLLLGEQVWRSMNGWPVLCAE